MTEWPVNGGTTHIVHPRDWKWVPITDVADLVTGHTPARDRPDYWNGGISWVNLNEIRSLDGKTCDVTQLQVSAAGVANSSAVVHPAGTVCMSRTASVGFVTRMGRPMATSQDFVNWTCGPEIDSGYLMRALRASRPQILALCSGSTHKTMYVRDAERLRVLLPPLEEQRRIAAVLDAVDALRAKRRQALAKLDTLTQAIFIEATAPENRVGWDTASIESLASSSKSSIRTGPFGSQLLHEEFTNEGVAVLGIDNAVQNTFRWAERRYVSPEKYEQLQRFTVLPGDVLVTIMGTCGRVAIVPDDVPLAINTKHLCCITLNRKRCLPEWLWACVRFHPHVLRQLGATHGAVMPGLNMGRIKQAEVPVPSIKVQQRFVERKNEADRHMAVSRVDEAQLDALFASLQQRAFRGEL